MSEESASRPPDLRLGGVAVGAWLAALAVLYGGVPTALGVVAVGAAVGLGIAVLLRRPGAGTVPEPASGPVSRWGWVAVAVLLGVVCGAAAAGARVAVRDAEPLASLAVAGATVEADVVVRDDPRPVSGTAGRPPTYVVPAELTRLTAGGAVSRTSARILVLGGDAGWRGVLPGQRVHATGRLLAPRGGDLNAAALSVTAAPELLGRPPWTQRAAGALRAGLQRACDPLPDEAGGLLPGLVVGDTSELDPAVEEDFRATGLTHLVAVSGVNVGIGI